MKWLNLNFIPYINIMENWKDIKSEKQYDEYLDWVDIQFNKNINLKSAEDEKLQIVLMLIKQYEDIHYEIPFPDHIELIKLKMNKEHQ